MSVDRETMISEFWNKLDESPMLMLGSPNQRAHSEPMTACFDAEYPNVLFFFTRKDNRLVAGLPDTSLIMAQYMSPDHDFFASLRGRMSLAADPRILDMFWRDEMSAWFTGGKNDPVLQVIRMDIQEAEMWKADLSFATRLKTLFDRADATDHLRDQHITATM